MLIPQWVLVGFIFRGVGVHIAKDGEPRRDTYCGTSQLIAAAFELGLLYWGGFFHHG